jgi:surface polysaccharide O-acyltransferase-like enzyme
MITQNVSSRLKALRFPLIVGVVFIHAYTTKVLLEGGHQAGTEHVDFAVSFVRNLISQGIARVAVPMFFLMSGYLFFQGYDGSMRAYGRKLQKRVRTLLVPFLLWNTATLMVYAAGEAIPATRVYFANKYWPPVRSFTLRDYANAFLGLTTKYTMSFQFWFIRDLMVLALLAPLFYLLRRRLTAIPLLLALFGLWLTGTWPLLFPADEAILFFVAGAYLSTSDLDICALDQRRYSLGACFALLLVVDAASEGKGVYAYAHKAMILVGLSFLWCLTGVVIQKVRARSWLFRLSASSFFVYAAHEPLLSIVRKSAFRMFAPRSGFAQLSLYFLIPACLITALVIISNLLSDKLPTFMAIITGGEVEPSPQVVTSISPVELPIEETAAAR